MYIREAKEEDLYIIKELCIKFKQYSPYKEYLLEEDKLEAFILSLLRDSNSIIYMTWSPLRAPGGGEQCSGVVVGTAAEFMFSTEKYASELTWYVEEEYRGTSCGKELHQAFAIWAKKIGCRYLSMSALEDQHVKVMRKLYKKLGFKPMEQSWIREL